MGRNKTSLSKPGAGLSSRCHFRPDDMITIDWVTLGAHGQGRHRLNRHQVCHVPLSFKTPWLLIMPPWGSWEHASNVITPSVTMCDCDTHYQHTWPPTHSPWHHNYLHSLIFIFLFPEHSSDTHTCGPSGADTVLMSPLIVHSVSGLIKSVMTFQPMKDCFARHLSLLQHSHRFFKSLL